jgi:transposase-like protein
MDDADFKVLLVLVGALSPSQVALLMGTLAARQAAEAPPSVPEVAAASAEPAAPADRPVATSVASIADIEAAFAATPRCPKCRADDIKKWGTANGLKRYRCRTCGLTFNCLTGTPLAHLHKRELWGAHAQALVDGVSLRKVASRIGVDLTTAFRWRHRFLKAPKSVKAKALEGTVEADETYFLHSEKGSRHLDRPARKRGGKASKRGLSDEQVPVLIARDRNKATTDQILDDRSTRSIAAVLEPLVAKTAVLVSDGAQTYRKFAADAGLAHIGLNLSAGERTCGIYHIQNVNNYCGRLKGWMDRFRGVATKYLDSYLGWHRINDRAGDTLDARRMLAAAWG